MKTVVTVTLAIGIAIAAAPPAAADETVYLAQTQPKLNFLSSSQLLNEGHKVCQYLSVGRESSDAVPMVVKDLGVSVSAAIDIVPTAIEQLC
jgi:hypothetical protein